MTASFNLKHFNSKTWLDGEKLFLFKTTSFKTLKLVQQTRKKGKRGWQTNTIRKDIDQDLAQSPNWAFTMSCSMCFRKCEDLTLHLKLHLKINPRVHNLESLNPWPVDPPLSTWTHTLHCTWRWSWRWTWRWTWHLRD